MKIPYGNADFADIRRKGMFYVDKTPFLPMLEASEFGYKNLIFLRPRRFGKSSLLSMMEHYYDISREGDFDALFRGLWIHEHPTPEKNKYLVLSLDFSQPGVVGSQERLERSFLEATRSAVRTLILRYRDRFPALARFEPLLESYQAAEDLMGNLMGIIAGIGEKLYILIDEYDTFANDMLSAGHQDLYSSVTDQSGFVRAFYRTIKIGSGSGAVARLFVTGGTPILLDDLMTGFNIVTNISNRRRFNTLVGFTRKDVERAVDELFLDKPELRALPGLGDPKLLLDVLEENYDGYRFSEDAPERVFNSNLVLYFLRELADRGKTPVPMLDPNARTDYRKLHGLWAAAGPAAEERRRALETILHDGAVWSELVEQFGHKTKTTTSQFVSLMYYTGMLTLSPEPPDLRDYRFETPNRVIRELGWEHYTRLLEDLDGVTLTDRPLSLGLRKMAKEGDIQPFLEEFRKDVLAVLGVKDLRQYNEKAMKMLLMGAIITSDVFHVLSEKEFSQGFCDLFLSPMPRLANAKYAWMLELKYLPKGAGQEEIEAAITQAEEQLRRYLADAHLVPMVARGFEVLAGTLVFVGSKEVVFRMFGGER